MKPAALPPPATITSGYPERVFAFTGKWARHGGSRYVARRNQRAMWNPVYMADNGEIVVVAWIQTFVRPEHEW